MTDAEMLIEGDLPLDVDIEDGGGPAHEALFGLIDDAMGGSDRSLYATEKKIGVSDIGGCHEYVRRLIADEDFSDPRNNFMAAFMGTAFGDHLEQAYLKRHPDALVQMEVVVNLDLGEGDQPFRLALPGHPDIVDPKRDLLIDGKTKNGLGVIRKAGSERKHQYQTTLYAKALIDEGVLTDQCTLALAYYDRAGVEQAPHIVEWTYDPEILDEAVAWLNDVIYALAQGEEASKDMPRDWCYAYCPFATACRGGDTDVSGLIEDEQLVAAIDLYKDALAREKIAKKDKEDAKAELVGVGGRTKDWVLRWVHIGESEIKAGTRRAYDKIDIRPNRG
jgi:hypothetical protein